MIYSTYKIYFQQPTTAALMECALLPDNAAQLIFMKYNIKLIDD